MAGTASARGFDRLAWAYRPLESFLAGRVMQRARTAHLADIGNPKRALILGEGPGRLLGALIERFPELQVSVVEQSAQMITIARKHLPFEARQRVRFIQGDVRHVAMGTDSYDLVVTPFILDCFHADDVRRVVEKAAAATSAGACWLHVDFQIPTRGWRRVRARWIHRFMYSFFNYTTNIPAREVHPPDPVLVEQGFQLQGRTLFNAGLIRSDLWIKVPSRERSF